MFLSQQLITWGNAWTSTDNGKSWGSYPIDGNSSAIDMLWARNQFVYVGQGDFANIFASADGIHWTPCNTGSASFTSFRKVIYANNQFVTVGIGYAEPDFSVIGTSPDGLNWNISSFPNPPNYNVVYLNSVAWGNGRYVTVGSYENESSKAFYQSIHGKHLVNPTDVQTTNQTTNMTATSSDGINWTVTQPQAVAFNDIIWDGKQFVAVGTQNESGKQHSIIATSTDGSTWTTIRDSASEECFLSIAYANNTYVVVGVATIAYMTPSIVYTSHDAKTWTTQSLPVDSTFTVNDVKFKTDQFVISGSTLAGDGAGGEVLTSRDGAHWNVSLSNVLYGLTAVG